MLGRLGVGGRSRIPSLRFAAQQLQVRLYSPHIAITARTVLNNPCKNKRAVERRESVSDFWIPKVKLVISKLYIHARGVWW